MARLSHFLLFLMTLAIVVAAVSCSTQAAAANETDASAAAPDLAGDQDAIGNEDGALSPGDAASAASPGGGGEEIVEGPLGSGPGAEGAAAGPGGANASSASPVRVSVVAGVSAVAGLTAMLY